MMGGGERHPLQVMAILHSHYTRLARLDGVDAAQRGDGRRGAGDQAGVPGPEGAGSVPRLGGSGVQRAIDLLASADLDLRGARTGPRTW